MATLGPYDYWAIEYAYKEIPPEQEKAELARIAARGSEAALAYATDEDASFAIDPEANQADLGGDPLEFARRRFALVQEMWERWQNAAAQAGRELHRATGASSNAACSRCPARRPTSRSTSAA